MVSIICGMENGECSSSSPAPKFKRRKVSAVRDFPPHCGGGGGVSKEDEDSVWEGIIHELPMVMFEAEEEGVISREVIELENVVEGIELGHYPIPSSVVFKERKYPPRRRVSVVRDFPARCGCGCGFNVNVSDGEDDDSVRVCGGESGGGEVQGQVIACAEMVVPLSVYDTSFEIKRHEEISGTSDDERHEGFNEEDIGGSRGVPEKELIVYVKDKNRKSKPLSVLSNRVEEKVTSVVRDRNNNSSVVVQCLPARGAPNFPDKQGTVVKSSPSTSNVKRNMRKKSVHATQDQLKRTPVKSAVNTKDSGNKSKMIIPRLKETETKEVSDYRNAGDSSDNEDLAKYIMLPRSGNAIFQSENAGSLGEVGVRNKVRDILRLFQAVVRKLLQGEETKIKDEMKLNDQESCSKRIDLRAAKIIKASGICSNTTQKSILGSVPGVEVGDFFNYRMELSIIGLHRPPQGGIDYLKQGNIIIATSIVASGGYANNVDNSDELIYTGQGGNAKGGDKQAEDQKLERGNLALKNSIDVKNPVRVIRGFKESKPSETGDGRPKLTSTYTYDGLYTVEKIWTDTGPHDKLVYKFELKRLPGQPELVWKEVKRSKKFKVREGRCVDDISGGKEKLPICAVNNIDDEKPPSFTYITKMMYPDWCQPIPPKGCDCKKGCSDSERCACAVKNGGEIPYNYNGAIVENKSLVYECGPSCKCPPSCHNRVGQWGIKVHLEIFKTESRGWGVRSLSSIPSGTFICEYLGELLDDKEAEQKVENDEYLFDIGRNFDDPVLRDGLSTLLPDLASSSDDVVENIGFTIDAERYGNVGRFINHSCSPNLFALNVLFDHADKRIPHVMLFAAENIPPLQELTYHYNYTIDQVFDSDGNVKEKGCYCGSSECTGRMY